MSTHIVQENQSSSGITTLRVTGEMTADDAEILARLASEIGAEQHAAIVIDIAGLSFIDSEAAAIIRRSAAEHRYTITGGAEFLQTAVDGVERSG
jgi:anti-anti-sigma factor